MIYYMEVNLICIIILFLFLLQLRQKMGHLSTDQRVLEYMIFATIIFCCSDMVAGVVRGQKFTGARIIIEASNLLYFEALVVISFLWYTYVFVRLKKTGDNLARWLKIRILPIVFFTIVGIANPFTHFFFKLNEENLYERNIGVYFHWVIVWTYFLIPTICALRMYVAEKHRAKKQEIAPMLYFAVAPAVTSVIQMIFYGVTTTQVGITISIVMICLSLQNAQVLTDALTGVNNRRGFDNYLADSLLRGHDSEYILMMIDVDKFKNINDQYGHMVGDFVLQSVADSLKNACKIMTSRMFLCRYGGDEFLIFGIRNDEEEIKALKSAMQEELNQHIVQDDLPKELSVSVGVAQGKCSTEAEIKELLKQADQAMYGEKIKKHAGEKSYRTN